MRLDRTIQGAALCIAALVVAIVMGVCVIMLQQPKPVDFLALIVFIFPSLMARGQSGADDPCSWRPLGVRDHQEPRSVRHPEHEKPLFALGMIRIRHVHRQDVTEDCGGLVEGDAVILEVRNGLLRIPFEHN